MSPVAAGCVVAAAAAAAAAAAIVAAYCDHAAWLCSCRTASVAPTGDDLLTLHVFEGSIVPELFLFPTPALSLPPQSSPCSSAQGVWEKFLFLLTKAPASCPVEEEVPGGSGSPSLMLTGLGSVSCPEEVDVGEEAAAAARSKEEAVGYCKAGTGMDIME